MSTPSSVDSALPSMSAHVGSLAMWVEPMFPEDSLRAVAREVAELAVPLVPVIENNVLIGAIGEIEITKALESGLSPDDPVSLCMDRNPATLPPNATGAEALRLFSERGKAAVIVCDVNGVATGVLTPSMLLEARGNRSYLGRVGGMATPFGVYLTNGVVSGGVNRWALVATGMLMFSVFAFAGTLVLLAVNQVPVGLQRMVWFPAAMQVAWMALFFLGIRLLPLSGTHAAEHMVVHAIERGEELKPEIVKRMPRVHPRCGTNLAVASMVFLGIMSLDVIREQELRLILAALVTISIWQPLGSIMQYYVTTRRPNLSQVQKGIDAGAELLERMGSSPVSKPSVFSRLAMSGLFQVFLGATLVELILYGIYEVLKTPAVWRVT